jgi:sugar-phosphatase
MGAILLYVSKVILFDFDGVLVDSGDAHRRVWEGWAKLRGLDPAMVFATTQGKRRIDTLRALTPDRPLAEENQLLDELMAAEEPHIRAYPGASELLRSLLPQQWAVVTSSRRNAVVSRLTACGLPLPAVRICAEDVSHGKPAPGGYLAAAEALSAVPAECLVIEDSPAGVAAGLAAGCTVYAVSTTHTPGRLHMAHGVFASLVDVAKRLGME